MSINSKISFKYLFFTTSVITRNIVKRRSILTLQTWQRGLFLLLNIRRHIKLVNTLSHPQAAKLILDIPEISYKYLRNYISFDISKKNSLAILTGHYLYLQKHFKTNFLEVIYNVPARLWAKQIDDIVCEIVIGFPHTIDYEGDLCLIFKIDKVSIYRIIFVISDGAPFGLGDKNVLFISSVQGMHDFENVKLATKLCHDIQPAQLLMAAMSGVTTALGFKTLVGIGNKNQISQGKKFYFSYNNFFEKYGALVSDTNFYEIPVPFVEKPLELIEMKHRKRTQKKRAFKNEISDHVARAMEHFFVKEAQEVRRSIDSRKDVVTS
ncbi:DUF535 family protein [Glaciimonas sp. GNP009]|uniref:DUF535 family protein n=2 Tax=Glaciimonas TaxID=1229970 RepID=UPI002AB348EA|nr:MULTISPECIES: DUF535 family protein [unclassified Glaciimonas]MDY7547142.1 DUF535 family protein [Glaciimonas sp. CA11.2]MEB0011015.1 DUF535 family protein [Glaciimonas sp. Cout2]